MTKQGNVCVITDRSYLLGNIFIQYIDNGVLGLLTPYQARKLFKERLNCKTIEVLYGTRFAR